MTSSTAVSKPFLPFLDLLVVVFVFNIFCDSLKKFLGIKEKSKGK